MNGICLDDKRYSGTQINKVPGMRAVRMTVPRNFDCRWRIWNRMREYFSAELHKTAELDPKVFMCSTTGNWNSTTHTYLKRRVPDRNLLPQWQ